MNRLTPEERRRVYLARQRARDTMLSRLQVETVEALAPPPDERGLAWLAKAAMIAALLGSGLLAVQILEFHPPDSLVGALLPRL
jgi:hypothetical protein